MTFNNNNSVFLRIVIYVILLNHQVSMAKNECLGFFSLSDEEDSDILYDYLQTLQNYSGLSTEYKVVVPVSCPNSETCIVNPLGSAIWQARLDFYTPYVLNTSTDSSSETLHSCICNSSTDTEFQSCLKGVRRKMLVELNTKMIPIFRNIVESDSCVTYKDNCQ